MAYDTFVSLLAQYQCGGSHPGGAGGGAEVGSAPAAVVYAMEHLTLTSLKSLINHRTHP